MKTTHANRFIYAYKSNMQTYPVIVAFIHLSTIIVNNGKTNEKSLSTLIFQINLYTNKYFNAGKLSNNPLQIVLILLWEIVKLGRKKN